MGGFPEYESLSDAEALDAHAMAGDPIRHATPTVEVPLTRDEIDALVFAMRRLGPSPELSPDACSALRMLSAAQSLHDLRSLQGERETPERRATDGLRRHASVTDALAARQTPPAPHRFGKVGAMDWSDR